MIIAARAIMEKQLFDKTMTTIKVTLLNWLYENAFVLFFSKQKVAIKLVIMTLPSNKYDMSKDYGHLALIRRFTLSIVFYVYSNIDKKYYKSFIKILLMANSIYFQGPRVDLYCLLRLALVELIFYLVFIHW